MRKKLKFIIPSLITLLLLLILFYFQGLYPFTNHSIVQVDADFQYIPVLYRIYDFLHGNAGILYDDIGLGNNIYASMIIQGSIFSPLSLLLYFTNRNNIVCFFNIIVIVKMCLLSLTIYIYINNKFKVSEYYKIIFSVLYSFSGWILLNYFNIMWLDSVILFPLIIMYLDKLIYNHKYYGYILTLSLSLIISYYISYFILLFILFYSFISIFIKLDKDKRKKSIYILGISTFIAILISSFSLLPALYQTFISNRFANLSSITGNIFDNFMNKSLYLLLSTIFLVFFGILLSKYKKDRKNVYCYLLLFILFGIGLFIEPINLAIHMGSYWSFPYRYSFITLFILMDASLYCLSKYKIQGYKQYEAFRFIIFLLFGILLIYLNNIFYKGIKDSQIVLDFDNVSEYINILTIFVLIGMMVILSLTFHTSKLKYTSFVLVCLIQIFIYSSWTMHYSDGYFLSRESNEINENMNLVHSNTGRYKMGYTIYTPDYGFIYNVNTLDNWLHVIPSKEINIYKRLGYGNSDTCVRSYGGTIFSDWLFNVKYLLSKQQNNTDMYTLIDQYEDNHLYQYNYHNGFGFVYHKENDNELLEDSDSSFNLQNKIYKELFDTDEDIIKINTYSFSPTSNNITLDYKVNKFGYIYLDMPNDNIAYIKVNNNYVSYTNFEENYIIDIGAYNSDITIEIGLKEYLNYFDLSIGFIDHDDIMNLKNNVHNVTKVSNGYDLILLNDKEQTYLFLPVNNIDGLKAYVNEKNVLIDNFMDDFVSIKLNKGKNEIKIRYEMPMFKLGLVLSILGIISLTIFRKIPINRVVLNVTYYIYIIVCILCYFYFYGYSLLKYYNF